MKVSVVMCTYNGQRFLPEQLRSLVNQSRMPDELIVCDDCSGDDTLTILNEFSATSPFVTSVVTNETNIGVLRNFERALSRATGDVIFLCDQDDVWNQSKVRWMLECFERDSDTGIVISDAELVDENGLPIGVTLWKAFGITNAVIAAYETDPLLFLLTRPNIVTGAACAVSRRTLDLALPFPQSMAVLHDAWLGLAAAAKSQAKSEPRLTMKYRQHAGQLVGTAARYSFGDISSYRAHLTQLVELRDRAIRSGNAGAAALIESNIDHLTVRLELSSAFLPRFVQVVRELSTGRYGKFSNGIRSAVKDLLRKT